MCKPLLGNGLKNNIKPVCGPCDFNYQRESKSWKEFKLIWKKQKSHGFLRQNFIQKWNLLFVYTVHPVYTNTFVCARIYDIKGIVYQAWKVSSRCHTRPLCDNTKSYGLHLKPLCGLWGRSTDEHTLVHTHRPYSVDGQIIDLCTAKEINVRAFKKRSQIILTP